MSGRGKIFAAICIAAVLLLLGTLSCCTLNIWEDTLTYELVICGTFGVPGMYCRDLRGGTFSVQELERDEQGRILYEFTALYLVTEQEETVLAVCQHYDSKYVYFYEDQAFCPAASGEDAAAAFKEQNDWGKPLDFAKMSRHKNKISFDLNIIVHSGLDYGDKRTHCAQALGIARTSLTEMILVDMDESGNELYWIVADRDGEKERYWAITDAEYSYAFLPVTDDIADAAALSAFKQENGWQYGSD